MLDFKDQYFLITGGASGIGRAIAWKLAEGGAAVGGMTAEFYHSGTIEWE